MEFSRGQQVEVCSREDGFVGSYFTATVLSQDGTNNIYAVRYKNLLTEDESTPLVEVVGVDEVRPVPPRPKIPTTVFDDLDMVDAFDNDGWWVGQIDGKEGSMYVVKFPTYGGVKLAYPTSHLRTHLEWVNGNWISSKKRKRLD